MKHLLFFVVGMLLIVGIVSAAPVTGAATLISSNNVTLASTGATGQTWFEYGMTSGHLSWKTPNNTATDPYIKTVLGSPLMGGQKYYYRACDDTGCGVEGSFTLLQVTPAPQPTFSYVYQNITESGFDPAIIAYDAIQPYIWVSPPAVMWGLFFLFIFAAMWIRGRDVTIPCLLGLITGFMLLNPTYGIGIPATFAGLSQGIVYASLAGVLLGLMKK